MAMSKVIMEVDCLKEDVSLESVKQMIEQQEPKIGLKKCDTPLFQWPNMDCSGAGPWKSDLFVIGNNAYVGQLTLCRDVLRENGWNFTLFFESLLENGLKNTDTFPSFQHFRCKIIRYHDSISKTSILSTNAFIPDARINQIKFHLKNCAMNDAKVEIYAEPSTSSEYVSPLKNAVVGKIEQFVEKRCLVFKNKMLVVSPRFDFGSPDHKIIVRFWRDDVSGWDSQSMWATLHIVNEKAAVVGLPFSLKVSLTIFNQKKNGKDFIKNVALFRKENECEFPIVLALNRDLRELGFLENDTMYYRVVVEPFNFELI